MVFWFAAVILVVGSLLLVAAPLLRGGGTGSRRASHDLQVFRHQLREVEVDLGRGLIGPAEAEAMRTEISRRLLAAADAEAAEAGPQAAPSRISRVTAGGVVVVAAVAAAGLYAMLGAPGLSDQPRAERLARQAAAYAARPSQAEAEAAAAGEAGRAAPRAAGTDRAAETALVDRLATVLARRPDDLKGHQLLARSLAALQRYPEARVAQERVVALQGDAASGRAHVEIAELMILAAGGYVSPEAEAALKAGLSRAPEDPLGRYYSGLALLQARRPDLAYPIWSRLLAEGPADAPWIPAIEANIDAVAAAAGLPPRDAPRGPVTAPPGTPPPGPSAADMDAASDMTPEQRGAMVGSMVARLGERLGREGGPPEDWARYIRALEVLGRRDDAAAVASEARETFADDPAALAVIDAAGR